MRRRMGEVDDGVEVDDEAEDGGEDDIEGGGEDDVGPDDKEPDGGSERRQPDLDHYDLDDPFM